MNSFNCLAYREQELVTILEDLDIEIRNLERKVSEIKERIEARTEELNEVRARMKRYLENELGVNTKD